jgi:dephospho-CoA kinase
MLIIGLTGGIGSGKSTVAAFFSELGAGVVDADQISRKVVAPKTTALQKITQYFGKNILNAEGELQRDKLREIIFNDPKALNWLENLLHPLILHEMFCQAKNIQAPYYIFVIPLLLEKKIQTNIHRVLVIDTPEELQIERTIQRDKTSSEEVEMILRTQLTRKQRLIKADDVISNDGNKNHLKDQVAKLHEKYLKFSLSGNKT